MPITPILILMCVRDRFGFFLCVYGLTDRLTDGQRELTALYCCPRYYEGPSYTDRRAIKSPCVFLLITIRRSKMRRLLGQNVVQHTGIPRLRKSPFSYQTMKKNMGRPVKDGQRGVSRVGGRQGGYTKSPFMFPTLCTPEAVGHPVIIRKVRRREQVLPISRYTRFILTTYYTTTTTTTTYTTLMGLGITYTYADGIKASLHCITLGFMVARKNA